MTISPTECQKVGTPIFSDFLGSEMLRVRMPEISVSARQNSPWTQILMLKIIWGPNKSSFHRPTPTSTSKLCLESSEAEGHMKRFKLTLLTVSATNEIEDGVFNLNVDHN